MIGTIRKCRICTKGGVLVAILVAAVFAMSQVTCLTHSHCEGADCFEHREGSSEHEADHECSHEPGSSCEDEHQDHDIHHHSDDGKTHPQRRFTAPILETAFTDAVSEETPVFTLAEYLPAVDESPPLERYGLIFAERAPPLS
ncbi:MAG: hypothetical protein KAU49_03195 [Candidatus Krumholzibacteria bacterium]|nr:hypothetical protein [Candidatus Krumholzibacteria bacterium]